MRMKEGECEDGDRRRSRKMYAAELWSSDSSGTETET